MTKFRLLPDFDSVSDIIEKGDALQAAANQHDIIHIFDDGGFRELVLLKMFNLTTQTGRHGDDAVDENGNHYELKTVNLINTKGELRKNPGITTCHHMNSVIIERYRNVEGFIIGIFYYHTPARIYFVKSNNLEIFFSSWEEQLEQKNVSHLNNPKMGYKHVLEHGELIYHNPTYDTFVVQPDKPKTPKKKTKVSKNQLSLFD